VRRVAHCRLAKDIPPAHRFTILSRGEYLFGDTSGA
jgi:hypothetical protein